jgi:putative ABC transport system permease protein
MFSILNAVVLRPLPYANPSELVTLQDAKPPRIPSFPVAPGRFLAWQSQSRALRDIAATANTTITLTGQGDPQPLPAVGASANLFGLLGVRPLIGRTFTEDEDQPGGPAVILLSESVWRGSFGAAPDTVGRTVLIDDKPTQVIGVMPAAFSFPNATILAWVPLALSASDRSDYGSHYLACYGRMKPDVTIAQARADLDTVARQLERVDAANKSWIVLTDGLLDYQVRNVQAGLWVLAACVAVLLLIGCANLASLLLARGVGRRRELGLRVALGATRLRLMRQLVTEHLVLGLAGSLTGLALAFGILRTVVASPWTDLPRHQTIALDFPTLLFALALAVLTPLVFGAIPVVQLSRVDVRDLLVSGARSAGGRRETRIGGALVVVEIALAVVLVAGASLLARSFARLMDVSPGFETDRQLVIRLALPDSRYSTPTSRDVFWSSITERATHLPGVVATSVTQSVPLVNGWVAAFQIPDRTPGDPSLLPSTNFYAVGPAYFHTLGIPLLRGRGIAGTDGPGTPRVTVISRTLAERYFGSDDPIGRQIRVTQGATREFRQIIGVVDDIKQYGLDASTTLQVYEPIRQHPEFATMSLVLKTAVPPENVTPAFRALLKEVDPSLPMSNVRTLTAIVATSVGPRRLTMTLLVAFAAAALLLASVGVYGLVAFTVGQRTREIGVRVALGASRRGILRMVFLYGFRLTATGIVAGVLGALWAAHYLESQLFAVTDHDPVAFGVAPLVLALAAAVACYWPARRALGVDPVTALRDT